MLKIFNDSKSILKIVNDSKSILKIFNDSKSILKIFNDSKSILKIFNDSKSIRIRNIASIGCGLMSARCGPLKIIYEVNSTWQFIAINLYDGNWINQYLLILY